MRWLSRYVARFLCLVPCLFPILARNGTEIGPVVKPTKSTLVSFLDKGVTMFWYRGMRKAHIHLHPHGSNMCSFARPSEFAAYRDCMQWPDWQLKCAATVQHPTGGNPTTILAHSHSHFYVREVSHSGRISTAASMDTIKPAAGLLVATKSSPQPFNAVSCATLAGILMS